MYIYIYIVSRHSKTKPCLAGNPIYPSIYTQPSLTDFTSIQTHAISERLLHILNIREFGDVQLHNLVYRSKYFDANCCFHLHGAHQNKLYQKGLNLNNSFKMTYVENFQRLFGPGTENHILATPGLSCRGMQYNMQK